MTTPSTTREHLNALLADLPPESLPVAEQFLQFLQQQARRGQPVKLAEERTPYLYPTVALPASSLDAWIGIAPAVGGDALADTEALYDEV